MPSRNYAAKTRLNYRNDVADLIHFPQADHKVWSLHPSVGFGVCHPGLHIRYFCPRVASTPPGPPL
jgi:hypothetical protein